MQEIVELANKDDVVSRAKVIDLCKFGKHLSRLEQVLRGYYASLEDVNMALKEPNSGILDMVIHDGKKARKITSLEAKQYAHNHIKKGISELFFSALDNNDAEVIIEIAQAALFFKDKRVEVIPVDRERGLLLFAKPRLELYGQEWTIREVAQFLSAGKKVQTPADGFSALRKKCRELNFPLCQTRQISYERKAKSLVRKINKTAAKACKS